MFGKGLIGIFISILVLYGYLVLGFASVVYPLSFAPRRIRERINGIFVLGCLVGCAAGNALALLVFHIIGKWVDPILIILECVDSFFLLLPYVVYWLCTRHRGMGAVVSACLGAGVFLLWTAWFWSVMYNLRLFPSPSYPAL